MATFSRFVKNVFLLLLLLQFAPIFIKNIRKNYHAMFEQKTSVGVVSIKGTLMNSSTIIKQFKKFFDDSDIKAIVIHMDCPGGAAGASQAIFQELTALKKQHLKPVIVWVENICASGGYYIASSADHIISTPSAFIGSIGVYIPLMNFKEFIEQFKVTYQPISAGEYKLAGDPFIATTQRQKEMLQNLTNDTYNQFVKDVAQQRTKLTLAQADEWAAGRVFTGRQALEMGLIDELGSPSAVEEVLKQKITVVGKIEYVKPPKTSGLAQFMGATDDNDDTTFIESTVQAVYNQFMKHNNSIKA